LCATTVCRNALSETCVFKRSMRYPGIMLTTLMTHKHASTTERYAHLMPNALKRAADASAEIMTPKPRQVLKIVKWYHTL
jgi:hypothetical protein